MCLCGTAPGVFVIMRIYSVTGSMMPPLLWDTHNLSGNWIGFAAWRTKRNDARFLDMDDVSKRILCYAAS
jgi:hypothetical protein